MDLVDCVKAVDNGAVNVDDCHDLAVHHDGHHDLALAVAVTGNVTRELLHVGHELCLLCRRGRAADTTAETDRLAGDLALERAKDKLRLSRALIENIEA